MQIPFAIDDAPDTPRWQSSRRIVIGFVCVLLFALICVWKLLGHVGMSARTRNDNSLNATLVWIPPGTFTMGSEKGEKNGPNVGNEVLMKLTNGFWLGQTEVTQGEWQSVMHTTPWTGQSDVLEGDAYPASYVSWNDALEFCRKLTTEERTAGRLPVDWQYTLPSEAQWEFACRAGTTTRFSFGDHNGDLARFGWFADNANGLGDRYPHRVRQKKANPWGLYDMHGNVSEWCQDIFIAGKLPGGTDPLVAFGDSKRVMRGGNWGNPAIDCQSAARARREPDYRGHALGFRLALIQSNNEAQSSAPSSAVTVTATVAPTQLRKLESAEPKSIRPRSIPSVTSKSLESFGEKYKGQIVEMSGCRFYKISETWIKCLPGVFVSQGPDQTTYNEHEYRKWCGFSVDDSNGDYFQFGFALKDQFGPNLLKLKRGDVVGLKGKCVELPGLAGRYGILCSEINE